MMMAVPSRATTPGSIGSTFLDWISIYLLPPVILTTPCWPWYSGSLSTCAYPILSASSPNVPKGALLMPMPAGRAGHYGRPTPLERCSISKAARRTGRRWCASKGGPIRWRGEWRGPWLHWEPSRQHATPIEPVVAEHAVVKRCYACQGCHFSACRTGTEHGTMGTENKGQSTQALG